jgi:hypothetical protein
MSSYQDLEEEFNRLKVRFDNRRGELFPLGRGDIEDVFALTSELLRKRKFKEDTYEMLEELAERKIEKEILMKTRGVFKYVTSCYCKDNTSTKNALVQVGYLDLDDNIVFNEPDKEFVGKPDTLVRYLPGFMVRGYRSCEEYVPITKSHNGKDTREIKEVISNSKVIHYCPSTYGSSPKVTYSVIGYLNEDGELIYYNQIVSKE